jgi:integrase/recombinase XerD
MQMIKIAVSIVLDKRRQKQNGTFPVKLRVFCSNPRKQKLYPTIFEFTDKEFSSIWETTKPRNEYKETRLKLIALESLANKTIQELKRFSFESFEKAMFNTSKVDYSNVFEIFDEVVKQKISIGAISTAEKYSLSKKSIQTYLKYKGLKHDILLNETIDGKFLEDFTHYSENIKSLSAATIGIYLRNLRSVYRMAIKLGTANYETYPFGKGVFQIPTSKKINKSLTESELKQLWNTQPVNEKQAFAKDFWFFSYYSYGMNTKDVCELKHDSVNTNSFQYVRAKTKNTKKERTIKEVPLTSSLKQIIERRKNLNSNFLFGVLNETDSPKQKHEKIKRFNKTINKNFREFALYAGINSELANQLGTYHARHSFATVAIRKGTSTALISEILHDGNLKVTENYINSFPKEVFKELSNEMEL